MGTKLDDEASELAAAWWGIDSVAAMGHRGLWGCAALLTHEGPSSSVAAVFPSSPGSRWCQDLRSSFLRRWVWRALVSDATAAWLAATPGAKVSGKRRSESNALAWARQCQAQKSSDSADSVSLLGLDPFDLRSWLPGGPEWSGGDCTSHLAELHRYLAPCLLQQNGGESSPVELPVTLGLWLSPPAAQQRLAEALWLDVRRQLLASEEA
ncbi:unnamed protein product, partial [Polarella glacialis]